MKGDGTVTNHEGINPPYLAFRGRMVQATYQETRIERHQGNPCIEAMPKPLETDQQITDALAYDPPYKQEQRFWPNHEREQLIQGIVDLYVPLPMHLDLVKRLARLLPEGYVARNPLEGGYWKALDQRVAALAGEQPKPPRRWSQATGFNIYGVPGGGKTLSLQHALDLYPQVIIHHRYRDQDFSLVQLVWLMLQCPFDGSTRGLCLNFFQAVDSILGTKYYANYARRRAVQNELIVDMARVASLHSLGVLVVDEVQFLNTAKSGGIHKMLNFFVELVNTIGVPVILVGTYKAYPLFTAEFRQARRGTGQGDMPWDPLPPDGTWNEFLESLWDYQYVQQTSKLTKEIRDVLYEVTCGIPDLAVKVFMLAQYRAIARGKEKITVDTIRSVAQDSLRSVNGMLAAVRRGDLEYLQRVGDIVLLDERPGFSGIQRGPQNGQSPAAGRASALESPSETSEDLSVVEQPDQKHEPTKKEETLTTEPVTPAENGGQQETTQVERSGEETGIQKTTNSKRGKTANGSASTKNVAVVAGSKAPVEKVGLWAALLKARGQKILAYQAMAEAGYARHYRQFYPELLQPNRAP